MAHRSTCSLCVISFVAATVAHADLSFQGLGHLPNLEESIATAVSPDGGAVVGIASRITNPHQMEIGFIWTAASGIQALDPNFLPWDISDNTIIVGSSPTSNPPGLPSTGGVIWSPTGEVPSIDSTTLTGVSNDGSVIVGTQGIILVKGHAIRWTQEGGIQDLGDLPGGRDYSVATGVSGDGAIVIGSSGSVNGIGREVSEPFYWTVDEGMVGLGLLQDSSTYANAISSDGTVIVGNNSKIAYRWTREEGFIILPPPPFKWDIEARPFAYGVSADGRFVAGCAFIGGMAVMWHGLTGYDLNAFLPLVGTNDWRLTAARDISNDGNVIVGEGTNPEGETEAFILTGVADYLAQVEGECGQSKWVDWLVQEGCWADAGSDFLGWVYVGMGDWIHWSRMQIWVFLPQENVTSEGGWVYLPRED